jgi:hypothetical protein
MSRRNLLSFVPPVAERAPRRDAFLAMYLLALTAACTHIPAGDGAPDRVGASPRILEDATACVVRGLDRYGHSEAPQSTTHSVQVIVPGRLNEVRPRQDFALSATAYFVRLEKTADQITRIALYVGTTTARGPLIKALRECGG